jgi:ABC-type antimicrobial peptide transport system permease subunit
MFYLRYMASELGRRRGRTVLTALCLAVGIGLVVTVTALSAGLDDAQSEVLRPLTGIGTDMTVKRPLQVQDAGSGGSASFGPPGAQLSGKEQRQLQRENGTQRVGLDNLGKPGTHFEQDSFVTTDLSFPAKDTRKVAAVEGVAAVSAGLTLNETHVSGKVPKQTAAESGAPEPGSGPVVTAGPPDSVNFDSSTISGVDTSTPDLGLLTRSQVKRGSWFKGSGHDQAVLSLSYANEHDLDVGDHVSVSGHRFDVVGVANAPVGGQSSDVYVEVGQLQKLSDHEGRVNVIDVRATSADEVAAVADRIEASFSGADVTTSQDLADQVSGSLVDAKNLSSKLGTALAIVALGAAFGIASLVTLSSVAKRTRELGTLKALGWRQRLVVRQVTGEALVQGLLGGVAGAVLGIGGAALIGALGINLDASIAAQQSGLVPPGGPFGQGAADAASSTVSLGAPIDAGVIALAIGLALIGGLIAGGVGGMRAARLRPAEALRSVE